MNIFFDSNAKYEIKIFQIDKTFYEFRTFISTIEIIQHIVDTHRNKIGDIASLGIPVPIKSIDTVTYYTYVYNEDEKESHWASFLPTGITANETFTVQQLSLALFAEVDNQIFAFVGGSGIQVISRYLNYRYGLEFYEYLADLQEDVINFITTRGISGKLSQQSETFRDGQKLADSLNFTNIPSKINLILREDLINSVFDFIPFTSDKIYLEISSYFCIKARVNFEEIHNIFKIMSEVLLTGITTSLTSFVLVKDRNIIDYDYRLELYYRIRLDMFDRLTPSSSARSSKLDIDFVHPSKLQEFYECDRFEIFARGTKLPFYTGNDRTKLYIEGLKFLYNDFNPLTFNYILSGIRVYGFKGTAQKTHAMFTQHITCELSVNAQPIFLIDGNYYKVKNDFINSINTRCQDMINKNYLRDNILTLAWQNGITEGNYNMNYFGINGFRVFDKVISQNIELCDLLYEDQDSMYFIHVKNGFDGKLRDLSNQIVLSSTRFSNDKNSGTYEFLDGIINSYNSQTINTGNLIVRNNFIHSIQNKEIFFVMAFKSTLSITTDIRTNVSALRSNIAKYAVIQCVRDMNTNMYPLKIFDLASIV
ncbi:TIGR04141 family sporadically distributed protein [Flavobacterium bizetiae]|uniref:DUF6119 family protein n=1 Tax=Flavobacterium bizetiae TaxID=2704140 RepID=UPI0021E7688D|nr:DUF6119 family protein [Flavobacterium bizetiae]UTN06372.1 TIGR04141 family sporadically distributed protein [Flavobacterium bizetiae]